MASNARSLADDFSKLQEELRIIVEQLRSTTDLLQRRLLLVDIGMLIERASRLIREHDAAIEQLLRRREAN